MAIPKNAEKISTIGRFGDNINAWRDTDEALLSSDLMAQVREFPVYLFAARSNAGLAGNDWIALNDALLTHKDDLVSTFLHEVAHVAANLRWKDECHHDFRWRRMAKRLGDDGERCHDYPYLQSKTQAKKFIYICQTCNHEFPKARKLKHDSHTYIHKHCGGRLTGPYRAS